MMRYLIPLLMLIALDARADEWTGQDKTQHLQVGALISAFTVQATGSDRLGMVAGCVAGAAKEFYDTQNRAIHTPSFKDFAVTCLGAYVGSRTSGFTFTNTSISYIVRF